MSGAVQERKPIEIVRDQIGKMDSQFKAALPAHIPVERFSRVVMTAIANNPDLLDADRRSLFNSAMRAAQDGLLPDGREGALVIYKRNVKTADGWSSTLEAVWMPMVFGIMKKARNSGEISSIEAHVVRANDRFSYRVGIDDSPIHEPQWFGDRGDVVGVWAVAKLKDGTKIAEIMSLADIEKVRAVSRAKDKGPWVDWFEEMARKTVIRRLAKRLPSSSDLDDLIRRDDSLYDFEGAREAAKAVPAGPRPALVEGLNRLASLPVSEAARAAPEEPEDGDHDPVTGEVATEQSRPSSGSATAGEGAPAANLADDAAEREAAAEAAREIDAENAGAEAFRKGVAKKAVPAKYKSDPVLTTAWVNGWQLAHDERGE